MTAEKKDLCRLTASEVVALTKSGELSVEDYARALIARHDARDEAVQAWAYYNPELILESARALDKVPAVKRGPLHGVAIGVKDVILTKDMPTQHNSELYKDDHPKIDAGCVASLRAAGALILGKTCTTEFAAVVTGPKTCNPHDPTRTAGGSSSGSGAAVGDFQCPIGLGTQTGGSTIRPGSFNSIYALKGTWNAITREGLKMYSITCDTLGLYARSAADLSLLCDVFNLVDDVPPPAAPLDLSTASFAFVRTCQWPKATSGTVDAFDKAQELLKKHGAKVEVVELPAEFDEVPAWHARVLQGEGRSAFHDLAMTSYPVLDPWIQHHIDNKSAVSRKMLTEAYDGIARLRPVIDEIAGKYTALVTPSVVDEAPVIMDARRLTGDASFNLIWTGLHVPVINVPGFKGANNLPIGLSLVGPRFSDQTLCWVAKAVGEVFEGEGGFVNPL